MRMLNCPCCASLLLAAGCLLSLPGTSGQTLNCSGTSASDNPAARDQINQGVKAYRSARYDEAMAYFGKATQLAPCLTIARMYLATAQAQNVIPALNTPDNLKIAEQAIANFQIVLAQDPHDVNSLKAVAGIYFSVKRQDDAREWQMKVLSENPKDPEAAYTIGVIDWTQAQSNALKALTAVGLLDDGEGNAKAPLEVLAAIKQQNSALIAEAMQYLTAAIADRPDYDDAMAYLNLAYRRKADTDYDDPAHRDEDIAEAKEWSRKAMLVRKENERRKLAQPDLSLPQ